MWQCLSSALQFVSGCQAFLCFKPADNSCPLSSSKWVAVVPCCVLSLLMMPIFCSPVGEWLLYLPMFWSFWWCLSSALQLVSGWCALLCFKPVDDACSLLSSLWVAGVPCCVSSLLMIPVFCSPGSEWLRCFAVCHACWWCLASALQRVSGYCAFLCAKPADDAYPLLSREWVASMPCCALTLLMMFVLCSPESEWLVCLTVCQACW